MDTKYQSKEEKFNIILIKTSSSSESSKLSISIYKFNEANLMIIGSVIIEKIITEI